MTTIIIQYSAEITILYGTKTKHYLKTGALFIYFYYFPDRPTTSPHIPILTTFYKLKIMSEVAHDN